jgi:hypothetical protein
MLPIPLKKRFKYYLILILISFFSMFTFAFTREFGPPFLVYLIYVFFIPHYIFSIFFLKVQLIYKLIVPFATAFVTCGIFWLLESIHFFDQDTFISFFCYFFLFVIPWEITYWILQKRR